MPAYRPRKPKFTPAQILEIRNRYWAGESQWSIARAFGSCQTIICEITLRHYYADPTVYAVVPGELDPKARTRRSGRAVVLTDAQATELRQLWWSGVEIQSALARRFGISQPTVWHVLRRDIYKWVQPLDGELDLLARWTALPLSARYGGGAARALHHFLDALITPEHTAPICTGTGRIQRFAGNEWVTFPDVRRAEIATGLDRLEIARALLAGQAWRYEPGDAPAHSTAILGDSLVWSDLHMNTER